MLLLSSLLLLLFLVVVVSCNLICFDATLLRVDSHSSRFNTALRVRFVQIVYTLYIRELLKTEEKHYRSCRSLLNARTREVLLLLLLLFNFVSIFCVFRFSRFPLAKGRTTDANSFLLKILPIRRRRSSSSSNKSRRRGRERNDC